MRFATRLASLTLAAAFVAAGCTGAATNAPSPSASPEASPSAATSPSPAASQAAVSPSSDACAAANLKTVTPGKLTIGTDNPAYPPYFLPPSSGKPVAPWDPSQGDPTDGRGFESATAYDIAGKLGFTQDKVVWVPVKFDQSFAPGPKTFDFDINQVSYLPERAQTADLSDGYYQVSQALVALKGSPIANAKSVADLKAYQLGAQAGTTSYKMITDTVQPTKQARLYDTNDAAIQALKVKQIDGLVVDLPTADFITSVQLDGSVIVGQFKNDTGEHFSVVLQKGSPLTACVNQAVDALKADGTLDTLAKTWLPFNATPVFTP
ncbi:MAG TPA: transporter substrate-binding domain-containing protein [Candidatus Dormibacteraeota bacterium]|nr:transporter substrate-binding domain-containing protein [Candidatus Dormibacteraeota bacterium]